MKVKSRFIVLEGMDFSGKTATATNLTSVLEKENIPVIHTREPGGCRVSELIREVLLNNKNELSFLSELLLFMAARNEHLHQTILPALNSGKVVVCERFLGSSIVYQSTNSALRPKLVLDLFDFLLQYNGIMKVLIDNMSTFVLDISHGEAKERAESSSRTLDRMDILNYSVYTQYRAMYKNLPQVSVFFQQNFHVIDASQSVHDVVSQILHLIKEEE